MNRKKTGSFFLITFCFCLWVQGQKVQYSRQTLQNPYAASMHMVGNVGGNHHLLFFNENKSPVIHVFDSRLQLHSKKEIDFKISRNSDVRVIRFEKFYYLYVHVLKSATHDLFKIDAEGNVLNLSKQFQLLVDRDLNQINSTVQLINHNEQLHIVAHIYFDEIKKIRSTIIQLNSDFNPEQKREVFFSFNFRQERLQQFMITDDHLLLLKVSRNEQNGNSLDLLKVDLQSGNSVVNSFNSALHVYRDPGFSINKKDSTILVYSMLREQLSNNVVQRTVFISKLDYALKVVAPISLLSDQFKNKTAMNFLLPGVSGSPWINMSITVRFQMQLNTASVMNIEANDPMNLDMSIPPVYLSGFDYPKAVRFTVLNDTFKVINDSLVSNKKIFNVQPNPFARFNLKNKAYLLLVQNLTSKQKGLLLINSDTQGAVAATDVRVVNKYDCLLSQLQVIDDASVIFPYLYKNEIGLIKITVDQ